MKYDKLAEEDIGKYIYVYDLGSKFFMIGIVSGPHDVVESYNEDYRAKYSYCLESTKRFFKDSLWCYVSNYREKRGWRDATPEEKYWLDMCIAANKFISKEKALEDYNLISEPQIFN